MKRFAASVTVVCLALAVPGFIPVQGWGIVPDKEAELYQQAFALAGALPRDSEEFVRTANRDSVAQLRRALDLTREAARVDSVFWGVDWLGIGYDGLDYQRPGQVRNLARLGVTYHEEKVKRGDFANYAADMAALVRMGHHFAEGQVLIPYLTSLATEGIVVASIARQARGLPVEVRNDLLHRLERAPAGPTLAEVFEVERVATRGQLWQVFAGKADLGEGAPPGFLERNGLTDGLRVREVVVNRSGVAGIQFEETADGNVFTLLAGESRGPVELIFWKDKYRRAVVRKEGDLGIVELAGGAFVPVEPAGAWNRLIYFVDQLIRSAQMFREDEFENDFAALLEEADGDVFETFRRVLEVYESEVAQVMPLLTMRHDKIGDIETVVAGFSLLSRLTLPALQSLRKTEIRYQVEHELLLAGLNHLKDPEMALPVSKITGQRVRVLREKGNLVFESNLPDERARSEGFVRLEFPLVDTASYR